MPVFDIKDIPQHLHRYFKPAPEIGLEQTPEAFVQSLVEVFREVRRVLRKDGVCWLNLGDSYAGGGGFSPNAPSSLAGSKQTTNRGIIQGGVKPTDDIKAKDLVGIPWMVAFALRADGWWLRSDVVWEKGNPMPESITDRPTRSHEYVFLLTKNASYFYDHIAVREPVSDATKKDPRIGTDRNRDYTKAEGSFGKGTSAARRQATSCMGGGDGFRNLRDVWAINTRPYKGAHFATMPPTLAETCIKAGTSEKGCCGACGAPWDRITESGGSNMDARYARGEPTRHGLAGASASGASDVGAFTIPRRTVGWAPTCECEGATLVPCTVMDPFSGSGTTGYVANRKGRNYIGIDLNRNYLPLAENRLRGLDPPEDPDPESDDNVSVLDLLG